MSRKRRNDGATKRRRVASPTRCTPAHPFVVSSRRRSPRRGFTLVEVIVAGIIAALVIGSVSMSLGQLGQAKRTSKERFDMFMRADAALTASSSLGGCLRIT